MRKNYLTFGAPELTQDDIDAAVETLKSGWIGTGPRAQAFEQAFADYTGARHAVALSSCSAALHLALLCSGIQPGDEVITSPVTYCATANAIIHAGAVPVFADVDPATGLMAPEHVEALLTSNTRAILPVHLAGRACDMDALTGIAEKRGLTVIEDCAHAIETRFNGKQAGRFGAAGCFSFYVTKNVTAVEGGMLITDDDAIAARARTLASNGLSSDAWARYSDEGYKHYEAVEAGFKYNLPDLHAAIGLSQLKRIDQNLQRRRAIARQYNKNLLTLPCFTPEMDDDGSNRSAWHLYPLLIDLNRLKITRDEFILRLHERNIGAGVHYRSLHLHRYYRDRFGLAPEDLPGAFWHSERTVSLPLSPGMNDTDAEDVIEAVSDTLKEQRR